MRSPLDKNQRSKVWVSRLASRKGCFLGGLIALPKANIAPENMPPQ